MCGHKDRRLYGSPAAIGRTCAYLLDAQRLLDDAPTALEFVHAMLVMYPRAAQLGARCGAAPPFVAQLTSLSCDVTAGAAMTPVPPHDPAAALNEVLSEVVDLVLAVPQARHTVREGQELDTELPPTVYQRTNLVGVAGGRGHKVSSHVTLRILYRSSSRTGPA